MTWQSDYHKFSAFFNQFERDLQKKDLNSRAEQSLVDNLNQVVEWGWKALQNYDSSLKAGTAASDLKEEEFSGNHALIRLKELFVKNIQIKSAHDVEYLQQNEWEIREVIHPAFKELEKFFENLPRTEKAD